MKLQATFGVKKTTFGHCFMDNFNASKLFVILRTNGITESLRGSYKP